MDGPISPQQFFAALFGSRAARNGEVIRRKVRDVERYVGRDVFLAEMSRRGYTVIENAGQFVVLCNSEGINIVRMGRPTISAQKSWTKSAQIS